MSPIQALNSAQKCQRKGGIFTWMFFVPLKMSEGAWTRGSPADPSALELSLSCRLPGFVHRGVCPCKQVNQRLLSSIQMVIKNKTQKNTLPPPKNGSGEEVCLESQMDKRNGCGVIRSEVWGSKH